MFQFVPRMPKGIDVLIQYWTYGCPLYLDIPAKKFKCAEFRKSNIVEEGTASVISNVQQTCEDCMFSR